MSNSNTNSISRGVTRTFYDDGSLQCETLTNSSTVLKYHYNKNGRLENKEIYSIEKSVIKDNELQYEQKLVYTTNSTSV